MYLNSPIEQFNLLSILCSGISNLSSFFFIIILLLSSIMLLIIKNYKNIVNSYSENFLFISEFAEDFYVQKKSLMISFVPTAVQYLVEILIFEFIKSFKTLINTQNLFIFFYTMFTTIIFILLSNLIGLIPYTFTITAQIFITFNLALLVFISFNIMGFLKHNIRIVELVVPSGVHVSLHFLLIPIEIISYIFRPISLSIRLFANIMAGHTLLKVICGFIYKFFKLNFILIISVLPFLIITVLFGLECFVALIQSYVFFILLSLFLKDILNLSH